MAFIVFKCHLYINKIRFFLEPMTSFDREENFRWMYYSLKFITLYLEVEIGKKNFWWENVTSNWEKYIFHLQLLQN